MLDSHLLHPQLALRADALREEFRTNQPFRHVVIEPFLAPEFLQRLITEFPVFETRRALNERGEVGGKATRPDLLGIGPAFAEFDRLMQAPEYLELVGRICGIPDLLYDPDYVGGGTHENLRGQELDRHVDFNYHPRTNLHRRLNLIVFLNPEWEPEWGGALELVNDAQGSDAARCKEVLPLANRAVIFETTERSWHGFRKIQIPEDNAASRRSIAVYFYTKERPSDETAPAHATIYYQRPLPDWVRAGHVLREQDVEDLQVLTIRRDTQIKMLYDRELEFSKNVLGSFSFKLGRVLTWPLRSIKAALKS